MNILMLTIGFSPNVGGIETHFTDFLAVAKKKKLFVTVLTYQPLETPTSGKTIERSSFVTIIRLPIIRGLFYKLVKRPFLEFLYLFPGLFFITPFIISSKKIDAIHAHGIIAGLVAAVWATVFKKKLVISTHSVYHFPKKGLYRSLAYWAFQKSHSILTLSEQSRQEILSLGVEEKKIHVFTYWVNQAVFRPENKNKARKTLHLQNEFIVLFVGRLVEEKGLIPLLQSAEKWQSSITLLIAGVGPLEKRIEKTSLSRPNIVYLGNISQEKLPALYNSADVLIVPSIHEEGFGRVIIEALSCGIPVIAAKRGGIREAMDESVGSLITISAENIQKTVEQYYLNPDMLRKKAKNAYLFAKRRYGERNAEIIFNTYYK